MSSAALFNLSMFGLGLALILGVAIFMQKRKSTDVYGFNLQGWVPLTDDYELYAIETMFTQGLVANILNKKNYGVSDWHSNLKNQNKDQYTGYIGLTKATTVMVPDWDHDGIPDYGIATLDSAGYRYFWGKIRGSVTSPILLNSLDLIKLPPSLEHLKPALMELEALVGMSKWQVIAYQQDAVILMPESFSQKEIENFLAISDRLISNLS